MANVYWSSIGVGDLIPALVKPAISRVQIAKFAAASLDYNPLHLDDDFAKGEGYGGVFAHGLLAFVLIEEALLHFAENLRIVSLTGTFHKLVWPGDLLTAKGLINEHYKEHDEHRIKLDVWVENQNQEVVVKGSAVCILWRDEKDQGKHRTPTPPFSTEGRHAAEHPIKERLANLKSPQDAAVAAKKPDLPVEEPIADAIEKKRKPRSKKT